MNLKILLPAEVFLVEEVAKVVVEGENGFFCVLPQHVDFTATWAPGVFTFTDLDGDENYLAVGTGGLA